MSKNAGFKVGVVGCGKVGMTAAFAMLLSGTPGEIVLIDRTLEKVEGEKLDMEHALPFLDYVKITASDDYASLNGCDFVVYTAGSPQKVGETRLDLCKNNKQILRDNLPKIIKSCPKAIVLIVANPVDVLTFEASKIAPLMKGRFFGSGTMLDTARFRFHLAEKLKINPHSVHTYVLGEHGDTSFPVFENALVGGQKLLDLPGVSKEMVMEAYKKTRDAAYKIIEAKGATYYAIGVVVSKIMEAIVSNSRTVYPLSVVIGEVALSMPCVLGSRGIERVLEVEFSEREKIDYEKSVSELKKYI